MPAVAGALLAGGRSQRFPGNKLELCLPGDSRDLATRAADALSACGVEPRLWLSPEAPETLPAGWKWVRDPGAGPKRALACALDALAGAEARAVLLLGADLPLVDATHLERLLAAWRAAETGLRPLCAADPAGRPQPVCAIYPCTLSGEILRQLDEGNHALFALLEQGSESGARRSEVTVSVTDPDAGRDTIHPCFNLNQVQDWEQLRTWSKEGKLP